MDISISVGNPQGTVDQNIYGHFIEHILDCIDGGIYDPSSIFADSMGLRTDVMEKWRRLAPPVLRFPGGTVTCQYHWEDAVGPKEKRIRRKNLIWGGELDPAFGTCEFITLCRELGAEPMICVNMASGTPEEASNWVEYCNGTGNTYYANLRRSHGYEEPFNVMYWCIGNECYAEPDIGIHNDVKLYIRDAMEFVKFMKLTDKRIKTLIVACDDDSWNKSVLDGLHWVTDYVSYHHYSSENGLGIYGPFAGAQDLQRAVAKLSALIDSYPEDVSDFNPWYRFPPRQEKMKIAIDEWNIWDVMPDEDYGLHMVYNWRDALWTASILNLFIEETHIGMANLAQSVNVMAPILTREDGCWYQTIAYPLILYRNTMYGARIPLSYPSPTIDGGPAGQIDAVSVSAVKKPDGMICIGAVNRDFHHAHRLVLETNSSFPSDRAHVTILTGTSPEAICTIDSSCVISRELECSLDQLLLPPGSVCLITIP